MRKTYSAKVLIVVLFLLFFCFINVTYSYIMKISKRDVDIIRVAYMNGAVEALEMDIEKIKELKRDDNLLKSFVYSATDNYIRKVEKMNMREQTALNRLEKSASGTIGKKDVSPYQW